MKSQQITTNTLARKNILTREVYSYLAQQGLIEQKGNDWSLTNKGVVRGGKHVNSKKLGKYIVWPDGIEIKVIKNPSTYYIDSSLQ